MLKKDLSIFDLVLSRINMVAALVLLLTYPAPYVNPQNLWFVALLGLVYPFALAINLGFLVYWIFRRKLYIIFSLIVILTGWNLLQHSFGFRLFPPAAATNTQTKSLKVMSYNVQNFDLYNWTENIESRNKMLAMIKQENPDFICFQEFYTEDGDQFENISLLKETLEMPYYHFEKTLTLRDKDHWGIAIFSRYPIKKSFKIPFENPKLNVANYCDIDFEGQTVRVFNGHLQSIHLGKADMRYVKSLKEQAQGKKDKDKKVETDHIKSSSSIIKKLKTAYVKRSKQAEAMAAEIARSPHPVVVCGDFNDTPASYAYRTIAKDLQDAFLADGFGFGGTYSGPLPSFRIDYILLSPELKVKHFEIIEETYSDHYPVSCVFHFNPKEI